MIRKAISADLPRLLLLYQNARAFMARTGNPNQWGKTTPTKEQLEGDIERGELYIAEEEELLGAFVFFTRPEPCYREIDGSWQNDTPYGTIHRVASSGIKRGFFDTVAAYAKQHADHLRIDTHDDNLFMQRAVTRNGFVFRGIIKLEDGRPRRAYEWCKE